MRHLLRPWFARRWFPAYALVVLALLLLPAERAASTHQSGELLPNLQVLDPANFSISTSAGGPGNRPAHAGGGSSEQRLLFDNEVMNLHTGPLELVLTGEKCTTGQGAEGRITVQRVYIDGNSDGGFTRVQDTGYVEYSAGCMTFHARHRHWHFDDFALFELRDASGTDVAEGLKMTFCIIDINRRADLMGSADDDFSPESEYYTQCSRNSTQGLSVGWGDLYPNGTAGQYLDVTAVPDGTYCFVSTADPLDKLNESDENDNVNSRAITLSTDGNGNRSVLGGDTGCHS